MTTSSWRDHAAIPVLVFGNVAGLVWLGLDPTTAVSVTAATGAVAVGMVRGLASSSRSVPPIVVARLRQLSRGGE